MNTSDHPFAGELLTGAGGSPTARIMRGENIDGAIHELAQRLRTFARDLASLR